MRRFQIAVAALACAVFHSAAIAAAPRGSVLNVRDFGAKGDGVCDDTAAVRAAVAEAARINASMRIRFGHRCQKGGVGDGPLREVLFPKGNYRLSGTVLAARDMVLRGEGGATISMTDPSKDIIYFNSAFRCRVSGLSFSGGAVQLRVWTANNDSANITVSDCRFRDSSGPAIECLSYSYKTNGQRKALAPYVAKDGAPVPNPLFEGERGGFPNSTLLTVEDCTFENCRRAMDESCDGSVMRNCRIVSAANAEGGVIKVCDRLHAYGLDVTVRRSRGLRQSVFEAGKCLLDVTGSSFRTDDGSGVCVVRSSMKPGYVPSYVNLEDVTVESGADDEDAPIVIERGTSPNMIRVAGLVEKGRRHASPVHYVGGRNEEGLAAARHFKGMPVERTYATEISEEARRRPSPPSAPARGGEETVLRAEDFGVDLDVRTDDTEAVKRLFAAAAGKENAKVVFPGTWIRLSDTVDLPGNVAVTAEGTAGFRMDDETRDIFRVGAFTDIRFSNLMFEGGRHAIAMKAAGRGGAGRAYALVKDCFFGDAASYAVVAISGDGSEDRRGDFDIVMDGGVAFTAKVYSGNGTAWDDRRWCEILPEAEGRITESVAWENRGVLVMRDMLGVPMSVSGMVSKREVPVFKETEKGDFRWIDNYGDFVSLYSRFGGEWGGQTPVYNYGSGRVSMDGGYAWFENRMAHRYPVLADSPSARLRLCCVGFSPNLGGAPIQFAWRDAKGEVRPTDEQRMSLYVPLNATQISRKTLIAHRGHVAMSRKVSQPPENTLASLDEAVAEGFGFECDVLYTKDGRVFTMHDGCFKRVYGIDSEDYSSMTWDYVSRLVPMDMAGNRHPETRAALFEEVCERARDGRWCYVELKTGARIVPLIKKIIEAQNVANPRNLAFISFHPDAIRALKRELPEYKAMLLMFSRHMQPKDVKYEDRVPYTADECLKALAECGADGLDIRFDRLVSGQGADFASRIKAAGYEYHVWVVDDLPGVRKAFANGAQTVTTNQGKTLLGQLGR